MVTSGFFNSKDGDRRYNADDLTELLKGYVSEGIFQNVDNKFTPTADNTNIIKVDSGRAWVFERWIANNSIFEVELPIAPSSSGCWDAIILYMNISDGGRIGGITYKRGSYYDPNNGSWIMGNQLVEDPDPWTPTVSEPEKPYMWNTTPGYSHPYLKEVPLCYIFREANSTTIAPEDIQSVIGTDECPFIKPPTGYTFSDTESAKVLINASNNVQINVPNDGHAHTKSQVGLGNVDNTADSAKTVASAATATNASNLNSQNGAYYLGRTNHTGTQTASTISDFAATVRSTALTGLSTATNAVITATDTVLSSLGKLQKQISDNLTSLTTHTSNVSNPHTVTKAQVGLGNVDNTADSAKSVASAATATTATNATNLNNQNGAYYLARGNHTGTQTASTISDFAATVRSTALTGLSTTTNALITATDSVLGSLGKLQAQINTCYKTPQQLPIATESIPGVITYDGVTIVKNALDQLSAVIPESTGDLLRKGETPSGSGVGPYYVVDNLYDKLDYRVLPTTILSAVYDQTQTLLDILQKMEPKKQIIWNNPDLPNGIGTISLTAGTYKIGEIDTNVLPNPNPNQILFPTLLNADYIYLEVASDPSALGDRQVVRLPANAESPTKVSIVSVSTSSFLNSERAFSVKRVERPLPSIPGVYDVILTYDQAYRATTNTSNTTAITADSSRMTPIRAWI